LIVDADRPGCAVERYLWIERSAIEAWVYDTVDKRRISLLNIWCGRKV
jgi:hypothetical protein